MSAVVVARGPDRRGGSSRARRTARLTPIATLLVLLPAIALAGCIAEPTTELTVRPGDLIRAELVLVGDGLQFPTGANASTVQALCGDDVLREPGQGCQPAERTYVVDPNRPADLPEGWGGARALPAPVVDALIGLERGEHTVVEDLVAFGPHDPELVEIHPLRDSLTRFTNLQPAYGRTWDTQVLANDTVRIDPSEEDRGDPIEHPRWCGDRFCLFESELVGWNETRLFVEHRAREGREVHVSSLNTTLTVTSVNETAFTVDGNDPRSGEAFDLYAKITRIRAPPEGVQRAPGFELTTVNGGSMTLDGMLGKPVVLEFFTTWCPSCIKNTDHLHRLDQRYGDRIGMLAIDVDPSESASEIRSFMRQNNVTWPIAVDEDGRVSQAYRVGSLSTEVIISPQGSIVHVESGVADHDRVVRILEGQLAHDHGAHDHGDGTLPEGGGP